MLGNDPVLQQILVEYLEAVWIRYGVVYLRFMGQSSLGFCIRVEELFSRLVQTLG
jgi:hypothetical protein